MVKRRQPVILEEKESQSKSPREPHPASRQHVAVASQSALPLGNNQSYKWAVLRGDAMVTEGVQTWGR